MALAGVKRVTWRVDIPLREENQGFTSMGSESREGDSYFFSKFVSIVRVGGLTRAVSIG